LEIERKGKFKIQQCPVSYDSNYCCDWCPLFGEPYPYRPPSEEIKFSICQKEFYLKPDELQDERE